MGTGPVGGSTGAATGDGPPFEVGTATGDGPPFEEGAATGGETGATAGDTGVGAGAVGTAGVGGMLPKSSPSPSVASLSSRSCPLKRLLASAAT